MMVVSKNCIDLIKQFEGCRLNAYRDAVGVWTIGYGHTGSDVYASQQITQAKAEELLKNDLVRFENNVMKYDSKYHWNQNQFDALVSFAFNIGSIDQLTNKGSRTIQEIADAMLKYNKAGGNVLVGLTRRRKAERELFLNPLVVKETKEESTVAFPYKESDYEDVYDFDYYVTRYNDVAVAFGKNKQKTFEHFINHGMFEGRQGCISFNVLYYKANNKDLRKAYGSKLPLYYEHYIKYGKSEKRVAVDGSTVKKYDGIDYSLVYDYNYYIKHNKDVKKAFPNQPLEVLKHFVTYGMSEGRRASKNFDVAYYKSTYADLRKVFGTDLKQYYLHFIKYSKREGRKGVK